MSHFTHMSPKDLAKAVRGTAEDLMSSFLYYDRKEDEDVPRGAIQHMLARGDVTVDELLEIFRKALLSAQAEGLRGL